MNRMLVLPLSLLTHDSVDHLAMKLSPDVEELKFNHRLWTLISNARICKRCSVNRTLFHFPISSYDCAFPIYASPLYWVRTDIVLPGQSKK